MSGNGACPRSLSLIRTLLSKTPPALPKAGFNTTRQRAMSKEPLLAKVRSTEEERLASFLFCSLQNDRGLNFLYLDEESSLRICLVNAGPTSYQTMTNAEPDRR